MCRACEAADAKRRETADPFRRERVSWRDMRSRCNNPNTDGYENYGGAGISVCGSWASFDAFLEDMGKKPEANYSIDRLDGNGDYEPGNCRWASPREQARNTSTVRMIEFRGQTMCMTEWAERLGMSISTLHARLDRGWSVERALTEPIQGR